MSLKGIAKATLSILDDGFYTAPSGEKRSIEQALARAKRHTTLYEPEALAKMYEALTPPTANPDSKTTIEVREGTTQSIARALVQDEQVNDLFLLSFASARNPGGGFIRGAKAQEEDIARCSGVYPCLLKKSRYYEVNRKTDSLLYTDHMIYAPQVPFFRGKNRDLLEHPFCASIITAPAPNAGQFLGQAKGIADDVEEALERRARYLLTVARVNEHKTLLLGAWGCGVFANDPNMVALVFRRLLGSPMFKGAFERVIFGIYDKSYNQACLTAFNDCFGTST